MLNPLALNAMQRTITKLAKSESVNEDALGQQEEQPMPTHPMLTAAKNLGAYGLGAGAGYGAGLLADAGMKKYLGRGVGRTATHAIPVVTGLAGIGFRYAQDGTFKKMRQDSADRRARVGKKH